MEELPGVEAQPADGSRVVANSMAPFVCRCPALESLLELEMLVTAPNDLLPAIRKDVSPIDDIRTTAAYRRRMVAVYTGRAISRLMGWSDT